jgi:hypothetical protein
MEAHLTTALWSALAMGVSLLFAAAAVCAPRTRPIDALNLSLEIILVTPVSSLTSQKPQFRIAPTAGGKAASIADLSNVVWSVSDSNVATVAVTADDQSAVELRPVAPGTVTLTVSATNKAGNVINESVDVTFAEPPVVVDALNLAQF